MEAFLGNRRAVVLAAAVTAVVLAVGVANAAIPDASGEIHACHDPGTRIVRVIDTEAGEACRPQDTPLSWNQTGPQGPQGPRGPSDGYVTSLIVGKEVSPNESVLTLSLPAGDYIVSGSVRLERSSPGITRVMCELVFGGGPFPNGYVERLEGADSVATIAATGGASLPEDSWVDLQCLPFGDPGTDAVWADLTAIRLDTVTRQ